MNGDVWPSRKRQRSSGMLAYRSASVFSATCLMLIVSFGTQAICQPQHPGGFWKCRTGSVKGEFGGEDVVGLSAHAHIPTDCELNWSDGHGKTYCFASRPSLEEFESNPAGLLDKAESFWRQGQTGAQPR